MSPRRPHVDELLAHAEGIRGLALRLCADVHAVDDALQDVWLQALRSPPRHRGNLGGFLARTLRNALAMRGRSEGRRTRREAARAHPASATADDTAELVLRAELHRELVARVLALPEPQRELVLRHYFEGQTIAALAARTALTADAVRAHLRRARARLRAELEGDRTGPGRAFALLVAATGPAVTAPATGTTTVLAAGVLATMKVKIALGAVATAAVLWFLVPLAAPSAPVPALPDPGGTAAISGPGPVAAGTDGVPADPAAQRTELPSPPGQQPIRLQVRLIGLVPAAPWTEPVSLRIKGRTTERQEHQDRIAVDASGAFTVVVPGWARDAEHFELSLDARDAFYERLRERFDAAVLDAASPLDLPVRPLGVITGKVVDRRGEPVPAARICAFPSHDGVPRGPFAALTNTAADGTWRLRVPLAAPLLVAAVAMHETSISGNRLTGYDGAIADNNQPRDDLLPACATAVTTFGGEQQLPPFVLPDPAWITGTVRWPDGRPVPGAELVHRAGTFLDPALGLAFLPPDRVCIARRHQAADDGSFRVPAPPGAEGNLALERAGPVLPSPEAPSWQVRAPQHLDLILPGARLAVRVLLSTGEGVKAGIEWQVGTSWLARYATDDQGRVEILVPEGPLRIRAIADGAESEWLQFDTPPGRIDLLLDAGTTAEATVEITAERPIRQATFVWRRALPGATEVRRTLHRGDSDGPFRMRVPVGEVRLRVLPAKGERNGFYLMPMERDLVVPPAGIELQLRMTLGGRIAVEVTDAHGVPVPGECRLTTAAGTGLLPRFEQVAGQILRPGRLPDGGAREIADNLLPGTYQMMFDLGARGIHRRTVEVQAREVTEVKIRLP